MIQAKPDPIAIVLARTAILVIDMQNAFVRKGGYFDMIGVDVSSIQEIIEPCKDVISRARSKGARIVYLQMVYGPDLFSKERKDSPLFLKSQSLKLMHEQPELRDKLFVSGSWGAEIIEELSPEPGDIVVRKQKYDGFTGTDLDIILRELDIRYLIFVGTASNICVESTLRRALLLDYFPILVSDAVIQKGPRLMQDATILNVQYNFGWVISSEKLLRAIRTA